MRSPCALFFSRVCTLTGVLACFALCACNLNNVGDPPPDADIYLPTGLTLSPQPDANGKPRFLYVINSNFDLRYNRGSLQAYDLDVLNARVDSCAGPLGSVCEIPTSWVDPDSNRPVLVDEAWVPSLATSFSISPDGGRFYLGTRTDPGLTFIELNESADKPEDVLSCAGNHERRCDAAHQRGADPNENARGLQMPGEPVDMVSLPASQADPDLGPDQVQGDFVAVAHRNGQVSLFHDSGSGPELLDVLSNLELEPTGIAFDPDTHLLYLSVYARGSLLTLPRDLLRVGITVAKSADDSSLQPSFTYDAGSVVINGVATQRDTRAIVMNPARPGELLVLSHDPAALLFVDTNKLEMPHNNAALASVSTRAIVSLGAGPLRMALGKLADRDVVAVTCFDSHQLFLIDANSAEVLTVVHNLNGPYEMAIDSVRQRLYLADFRASTIQIVELKDIAAEGAGMRTDAPIVARLGVPKVLQELQ